jgi:hypothetical protein
MSGVPVAYVPSCFRASSTGSREPLLATNEGTASGGVTSTGGGWANAAVAPVTLAAHAMRVSLVFTGATGCNRGAR